jgi:hypothetical protein
MPHSRGDSGDVQTAITRKGPGGSGVPIRGSLVNCGDLTLAADLREGVCGSCESHGEHIKFLLGG